MDSAGSSLINPNRNGYNITEAFNAYSYCRNNPVNYVDPDGNIVIADDILVYALIFALGACVIGGTSVACDAISDNLPNTTSNSDPAPEVQPKPLPLPPPSPTPDPKKEVVEEVKNTVKRIVKVKIVDEIFGNWNNSNDAGGTGIEGNTFKNFGEVVKNPKSLWGKTADEVKAILGEGWKQGSYGKTGTGWKFIKDDMSIFYHEGGRHGGTYYGFSSGATGKVKIVGPDYIPLPGDKATIINVSGE